MTLRNRIGLYGAYLFGMSGIGFTLPFLPLYLSQKGLADGEIGMVSTLAALTALAQFPIGLLADRFQWRKPFLIVALALLAISTVLLPGAHGAIWLGLLVVLFAENGICRAVVESLSGAEAASMASPEHVGSALGALRFFRPAGVVVVALMGGLWAERYGVGSVLVWLAVVQCLAVVCGLLIQGPGHRGGGPLVENAPVVRGFAPATAAMRMEAKRPRGGYDRALWAFIAVMVLFHFCNAPAGVYLGLFLNRDLEAPMRVLSYSFVVSMIAWAVLARPAGRLADRIGRRPLLVVGWMAMSVRLVLLAIAEESWQVVAVQVLDGVASGLFSVLAGAWVTDRLGDARRVSEAQAIVGTSLVFGSALGPAVAAQFVDVLGYRGLFGALAIVGGISTLTLMAFVPETLRPKLQAQVGPAAADEQAPPAAIALECAGADIAGVYGESRHDDP
ncbi:MAG TPA: MFS transporter [Pirellulales bacterium]|nr:MFS transporter [Pirellulales bacterium]